jgi:hypothetical protein
METTTEFAITVKGQATIPKPIREHLGLKPGDGVSRHARHTYWSANSLNNTPASSAS